MDLGHAGARVIVTGAGANIGRGTTHCFAREGARVLVVDIDAERAEAVAGEALDLGAADARPCGVDLTTEGAGAAVVTACVQAWGGVDVLVNNAGWSEPGWFAQQTDRALWQKTVEVNLFSAIDCTQAALCPMRMIALARTVAKEHGRHGIRSNVVAPGMVVPPDGAPVGAHSVWARGKDALFTPDQVDAVVRTQALRRPTTPDDIGNAVLWISSPIAARQVTGQVVAVGGGSTMP